MSNLNQVFERDPLKEQEQDNKVALYVVLRAAEYGCEQKHIKHVAGMLGYSWPAPQGDLENWKTTC